MISNTKLKIRIRRKTNSELASTIKLASKQEGWSKISQILSGATRKYSSLNLFQIDKESKTGDTIVIPGKVLSKGDLTKRIKICALAISEQAKEKLKNSKSEFIHILEEIKKNPKAEGIKILQ